MHNYKNSNLTLKENNHFKWLRIIYFTLLLGELAGLYLNSRTIELIFKPSVMLVLIVYYTLLVVKVNYWYFLALLLTLVFDTIHIYNKIEFFFVAGIMIAPFIDLYYICYLTKKNKKLISSILIVSFIFILIGGFLIYIFSDNFTNVIIPIVLKQASILILCSISFVNYLRKNSKRNLWLFISFILIFLADICFGIYMHYNHNVLLNILVVLIYSISHYISFVKITERKEFLKSPR